MTGVFPASLDTVPRRFPLKSLSIAISKLPAAASGLGSSGLTISDRISLNGRADAAAVAPIPERKFLRESFSSAMLSLILPFSKKRRDQFDHSDPFWLNTQRFDPIPSVQLERFSSIEVTNIKWHGTRSYLKIRKPAQSKCNRWKPRTKDNSELIFSFAHTTLLAYSRRFLTLAIFLVLSPRPRNRQSSGVRPITRPSTAQDNAIRIPDGSETPRGMRAIRNLFHDLLSPANGIGDGTDHCLPCFLGSYYAGLQAAKIEAAMLPFLSANHKIHGDKIDCSQDDSGWRPQEQHGPRKMKKFPPRYSGFLEKP